MPHIVRRFIETIVIMLAASLPIYILIQMGIIQPGNFGKLIAFSIDAVIFFGLSAIVLRSHLMALDNWWLYAKVNGLLFVVQAAGIMFCSYVVQSEEKFDRFYTMLAGFTKVFRAYDLMPLMASAGIIMFLYLIEIALFPILRYYEVKNMPVPERIPDEYIPEVLTELPHGWEMKPEDEPNQPKE